MKRSLLVLSFAFASLFLGACGGVSVDDTTLEPMEVSPLATAITGVVVSANGKGLATVSLTYAKDGRFLEGGAPIEKVHEMLQGNLDGRKATLEPVGRGTLSGALTCFDESCERVKVELVAAKGSLAGRATVTRLRRGGFSALGTYRSAGTDRPDAALARDYGSLAEPGARLEMIYVWGGRTFFKATLPLTGEEHPMLWLSGELGPRTAVEYSGTNLSPDSAEAEVAYDRSKHELKIRFLDGKRQLQEMRLAGRGQ